MASAYDVMNDRMRDVQTFYKEHLRFLDQQKDLPHATRCSTDFSDHNERPFQIHVTDCQGFEHLDVIFLGKPYPPCRRSLRDLESVSLNGLLMNHHHTGKFMLAKLVSVAKVSHLITSVRIEDTNGDFEVLAAGPACMNAIEGCKWLDVGHWFAIKEPFLTIGEHDKRPCIRIDHPSDLMDVESLTQDLRDLEPFAGILRESSMRTPLQCKDAGNTALLNEDVSAAHAHYIRAWFSPQDLHRNRSHVRLRLGRYEGARADALAAVTQVSDDKHIKLDVKAYFRAASASYKLKQFHKAEQFLQTLLELMSTDKGALILLRRVKRRLREQQRGEYDTSVMRDQLPAQQHVDAADYLVNTTIGTSAPGHGRGLFATRDLKPGDLIMAETAFCHLSDEKDSLAMECSARKPDNSRLCHVGLWTSVTEKIMNNPVLGNSFLQLHCTERGFGTQVDEVDGLAVVDTYQTHDMAAGNAFGSPVHEADRSSSIWIRSAYINHSCIPNAERTSLGDMLLIHCTRSISKGDEILMSYIGFDKDDSRANDLASNWSFQCDCLLCLADGRCSNTVLAERASLISQFRTLYEGTSPEKVYMTHLIKPLESLATKIAATYDSELYSGLPKTALISIQALLLQAYICAKDTSGVDRTALGLLRTLGHTVDEEEGNICAVHPTANSIVPRDVPGLRWAMSRQAIAAHDAGYKDWSQNLLQFARLLELVDCATDKTTMGHYSESMKPHKVFERMQAVFSQLGLSN